MKNYPNYWNKGSIYQLDYGMESVGRLNLLIKMVEKG